jgi:Pyruvate/2-oxoacid:ferredoxin oxidoreductase gamma subunit
VLIAFNAPSLEKFGPTVQPGGTIIYDSSVIPKLPTLDATVKVHGVPFTQVATDLGKTMVKNVVAWGALRAATELFPRESFLNVMRVALQKDCSLLALNEEAFGWGERMLKESTGSPEG